MSLKSLSVALLATAATYSVAPAMAAGDLNVICSADVVICEQLQGDFEAKHDIKVNMVRLSSGESYAKIRAESRNPKTDIWWGGTGDPHLQAASENLTQEYKSEKLADLHEWAQKQAESSGFKTVGEYQWENCQTCQQRNQCIHHRYGDCGFNDGDFFRQIGAVCHHYTHTQAQSEEGMA